MRPSSAAAMAASGRRLLSVAAAATENTKFAVPVSPIRRLARAGRLAEVDALLAPLVPSHPIAVISVLSLIGLSDRASAILSTVPSPTAAHLNALLGPLLQRRRHAKLVPDLLDKHPSAPRDAATRCILAKSICITKGADDALHLLAGDEPPSLQLYTAIIDSYYKEKKPHRAEELWREMVENHGIVPDAAAHNVRITYKSKKGTVEEVEELIRAMREEAGLQPDIITYHALIQVLARHKRVDEAVELCKSFLKEEEESAVALKCRTYSYLVTMLCGEKRWSEAEGMFYEGVKRQKVADLGTVHKLVSGLKEAGKGRAARRVVVGLRKKFPDQFDGPWKVLEEAAGLTPGTTNEEEEGEEEEEQQLERTATAV